MILVFDYVCNPYGNLVYWSTVEKRSYDIADFHYRIAYNKNKTKYDILWMDLGKEVYITLKILNIEYADDGLYIISCSQGLQLSVQRLYSECS